MADTDTKPLYFKVEGTYTNKGGITKYNLKSTRNVDKVGKLKELDAEVEAQDKPDINHVKVDENSGAAAADGAADGAANGAAPGIIGNNNENSSGNEDSEGGRKGGSQRRSSKRTQKRRQRKQRKSRKSV